MRWALLTSTLALSMAAAASATAACPPSVSLSGPPALVERAERLLLDQGVDASPQPGCPAIRCHMTATDEGVALFVETLDGRTSARVVATAEIAAVVIESWLRDDLYASMLGGVDVEIVEKTKDSVEQGDLAAVLVEIDRAPIFSPLPEAEAARKRPDVSVGLLATASASDDGGAWLGGSVAGCFFIGPLCVGALLRLNYDTELTGSTRRIETERSDTALLLSAEYPLSMAGLWLTPGLSAGLQRFISSVDSEETGGLPLKTEGAALVAGAHVRLDVPLRGDSQLEVGLFADISPMAQGEPVQVDGFSIVGEPTFMIHLGVGYRYGAP